MSSNIAQNTFAELLNFKRRQMRLALPLPVRIPLKAVHHLCGSLKSRLVVSACTEGAPGLRKLISVVVLSLSSSFAYRCSLPGSSRLNYLDAADLHLSESSVAKSMVSAARTM